MRWDLSIYGLGFLFMKVLNFAKCLFEHIEMIKSFLLLIIVTWCFITFIVFYMLNSPWNRELNALDHVCHLFNGLLESFKQSYWEFFNICSWSIFAFRFLFPFSLLNLYQDLVLGWCWLSRMILEVCVCDVLLCFAFLFLRAV